MNPAVERFPYQASDRFSGSAGLSPYLPILLSLGTASLSATALVDSGASVNVLPHDRGLELGAVWDRQTTRIRLTGNLAAVEARGILVDATVGGLSPVRLAFAWTLANDLPIILGQTNFFLAYDVCFFRTQGTFEIRPAASTS